MHPRILFVLKQSQTSGTNYNESGGTSRSGLLNSAKFVKNALHYFLGIESKIAIVVDGNGIDKEVHSYKPDIIILEALWCPPTKIEELIKLYPKKQWIVRIHSKTPFLANEGIALLWIKQLSHIADRTGNLAIAFNAKETYKEFKEIGIHHAIYLPNFYYPDDCESIDPDGKELIDRNPCFYDHHGVNICSFGAVRPMKNQLIQAIAAIEYADKHHKKLYFSINGTRVEQKGEQALKNIRALFENSRHELVEWDWFEHGTFVYLISKMDVALQVSLSESFNIATADAIHAKVPVVVSEEIDWLPFFMQVDTGSAIKISNKISFALKFKKLFTILAEICLDTYNLKSLYAWKKHLEDHKFHIK